MAVTVSAKNYTLIDDCEALGTWSGETPAVVGDFYKQGSNCLGFIVRGVGNQDSSRTGNWDLSGTKHFRYWFMTVAFKELNWVQFFVSDGANTGYYDVLAIADYPGGWFNVVVDLSRNVDAGTKPNMASITEIGFRYNNSAQGKQAQNTWIDHLCICDGLIAYGDDAGSPFDFADILAADENVSNGWGMIRKIGGVYYLVGDVTLGDAIGTNSCDFKDTSQLIVFEDRKVNSNLYNITAVGNATGITKFQLGSKSGVNGIQGCTIKSEGTSKYDVICTDTDVSDFKLYGCTFNDADSISLPLVGTNREVISCNFEACGEVLANTCKVQYCKIISSDTRGIRMSSTSHGIIDCDFIGCPDGINIPNAGTYTFSNLQFSGNTKDVEWSGTGDLTINITDGGDTPTWRKTGGGNDPTINNNVWLRIYVKDEQGNNIQNAQTSIHKTSDDSQLMNEDTDVNGKAEEQFNYVSDTDIYIDVRKSSEGATKYKPFYGTGKITTIGFTLTIRLMQDPNIGG